MSHTRNTKLIHEIHEAWARANGYRPQAPQASSIKRAGGPSSIKLQRRSLTRAQDWDNVGQLKKEQVCDVNTKVVKTTGRISSAGTSRTPWATHAARSAKTASTRKNPHSTQSSSKTHRTTANTWRSAVKISTTIIKPASPGPCNMDQGQGQGQQPQVPSLKHQAIQGTSCKLQAPSGKLQA